MKFLFVIVSLMAVSTVTSAEEVAQKVCVKNYPQKIWLDKCQGNLYVDIKDGRSDQLTLRFEGVKECSKLDITKIGGRPHEGGYDQRLNGNSGNFYGSYYIVKSFMVGGTNKIEFVVRSNKGYQTGNLDRVAVYVDKKGDQLVPTNMNCR